MAAGPTIGDEWLPQEPPLCGTFSSSVIGGDGPAITIPVGTSLARAEYQLIRATLAHFNNHKERTAAVLGVSLKTLYNRLKEYASESRDE
jgi:DNA-binding NtrC family response regulator